MNQSVQPIAHRPRIAITLGDPCGIGSELLLGSLFAINRWADVIVIGSKAGPDLLEAQPAAGTRVRWRWGNPPGGAPDLPEAKFYSLWTGSGKSWEPSQQQLMGHALWIDPTPEITSQMLKLGEGSAASGKAAVEAVRIGAQLVMADEADAMVTLPLSKASAHLAGYDIPGHTEFLQQLSGSPITRMAFVSPSLKIVLHTVHQSLRSVVEGLTAESVAQTLGFAADRFIQLMGKNDLRVALCALNPHAGEGGVFGEEETILAEAVVMAEAAFMDFGLDDMAMPFEYVPSPFSSVSIPEGWEIFPSKPRNSQSTGPMPLATTTHSGLEIAEISGTTLPAKPISRPAPRFFGPLSADSLFHRAARGEFDLVVALYHDQGLIPIKVLEPARAVNLTLGLPFIRTSPDHGTAFDKAGLGQSDATNFLEATALAVRLAARAKQAAWRAEVGQAKGLD
ncbi:MAG: 4-hydroxythreonine-4-phosphate dehydrogenase PdxA [Acidobacteriota bacterium]|nr:4-hydroxythreonine-4-phosphate dehydrogenase PdxA [Acidobacteriota bacterium]